MFTRLIVQPSPLSACVVIDSRVALCIIAAYKYSMHIHDKSEVEHLKPFLVECAGWGLWVQPTVSSAEYLWILAYRCCLHRDGCRRLSDTAAHLVPSLQPHAMMMRTAWWAIMAVDASKRTQTVCIYYYTAIPSSAAPNNREPFRWRTTHREHIHEFCSADALQHCRRHQ